MGKKFPKRPSDLWKTKKSFMTPAEMHKQMREIVEEEKKQTQQPKTRSFLGKTMREMRDYLKGK